MKQVDLFKLTWFDIIEKNIISQNGMEKYLVFEYEMAGKKDFFVMGKVNVVGLKQENENINLLVPIITEIINCNKKNMLRQEKTSNYGYQKLKTHPATQYVRFTTEFYDFLTAKFDYTNNLISSTVELQKHENKYVVPPELNDQNFKPLSQLESEHLLSDKDVENMELQDLKRYAQDHVKEIKKVFESNSVIDEKYQNEYNHLLRKNDVDQLAYRYYLEKYPHAFLTLDEVVNLGDEELKLYIQKKQKKILENVSLSNNEKAEIIATKDYGIEDCLFKIIANKYEKKWLDTNYLAELNIDEVQDYIQKNMHKILAIVENDEHYSELYSICLANSEKRSTLLMFFIDLKIAKNIIKENKKEQNNFSTSI